MSGSILLLILVAPLIVPIATQALEPPQAESSAPDRFTQRAAKSAPDLRSLRQRLQTTHGVLVIGDATIPPEMGDDRTVYSVWWHDTASAQVYIYGRRVFGGSDLVYPLRGLERDFDYDVRELAQALGIDYRAVRSADLPDDSAAWLPASRRNVYDVMAVPLPDDGKTLDAEPDVLAACLNCSYSTLPDEPVKGADLRGPTPIHTLHATPLPDPGDGLSDEDLVEIVIEQACIPCGGGGGGDPCAGVSCDDGNPCTSDSCSSGSCVFEPVISSCCDGSLSAALSNIQQGIAALVALEGLPANLDMIEPTSNPTGASLEFSVFDSTGLVRVGTSTTTCGTSNTSGLTIEVADGSIASQWWTLTLDVWLDAGVLHMWGTINFSDVNSTDVTYQGGWTYSDATGPLEDPASEPGFGDEVGRMLNLASGGGSTAQGGGFGLGTIIQMIGNIAQLAINYLLDLTIPYTPPTTCDGPSIDSSCTDTDIPCANNLDDMCVGIADLANVTNAFRKCMKGRCGCGGSFHPRARITCDDQDSCGPCGNAFGCNIGGGLIQYCDPTNDTCACANTVFHEMAHACGAAHNSQYYQEGQCNDQDTACNIGDEFQTQCISR